ncbi:MAG TPA: Hsp20/alpha crystallin family protein [Candidatus Methanoculleus thermohydrogenotrophicum]|jgi:HSP20 family protein|nr:Hsp20/alpha crystallin family protein [Candidatus Methanoculleus thermohydrogenotrophicum]HPZ37683.1 Hsp20/alpha crystallin family protein [Candidatus Methanoculleus thermohydrogenotrophicum]HQC91842.1 Hsp20/alpha crystallin family protein [Candidatus Methanoculleus thermohydrogenotrophicum]
MAWRATPRGFRVEFDEMLADMQREFAEMMERISGAAQQIPLLGGAEMTIDVREHDADVIVVADLPGVESKDISVRLLDPRTLRISARREEAREAEQPGYYIRERRIGAISRTVSLPSDVTEEEARATFKNGVLEVRLKKTAERGGKAIPVSGEIKMIEPGMQGNPGAETTAERLREHKEELYEE